MGRARRTSEKQAQRPETEAPRPPAEDVLDLRTVDPNGDVFGTRISVRTPLRTLVSPVAFFNRVPEESVHLVHQGADVRLDRTPQELGMQSGDTITVVIREANDARSN